MEIKESNETRKRTKIKDFIFFSLPRIVEYQQLIMRNSYVFERVKGVGIIGGDETKTWVLSGSMLRAYGIIQWDHHQNENVECDDEFD